MAAPDTTTQAHADTRPANAEDLRDYAPIPRAALGLTPPPAVSFVEHYLPQLRPGSVKLGHSPGRETAPQTRA